MLEKIKSMLVVLQPWYHCCKISF